MTRDRSDVNWNAIFRRHSWWFAPAEKRTFVIVQRWHDNDGKIEACELLEYKKEQEIKVDLQQMITWLHEDYIVPTSTDPIEPPPEEIILKKTVNTSA